MRLAALSLVLTACTHQTQDFDENISVGQWLAEPCASQDCYNDDAITVEEADGMPQISFPDAGPDQRLPNMLTWTELDEAQTLEAACDAPSGIGFETGLFSNEDYPVRFGDTGDTNAFQRLLGAPSPSRAPEVVEGRVYVVSAVHKDRFNSSSTAPSAWSVVFTITPDGLDYALFSELCE